jgi:hypothetical protein
MISGHLLIIIYEKDLFDYSRGEPDGLTVLRALQVCMPFVDTCHDADKNFRQISQPYVERILINQAHIEKIFLAPTRRDGEQVLASARGGTAWTRDWFRVIQYPLVRLVLLTV